MLELQQVFDRFADPFLDTHPVHAEGIQAARAIRNCRTSALGGHMDQCEDCHDLKVSYNSCRNRNCPKCGNMKKEQWVLDRSSELLPVPYFHTVFTVPHELNPLFLSSPKVIYTLLFQAVSKTLTQLALDPKLLGAQIGMTLVLHTWGQNLSFHPHVHGIVSGGGLSPSGCSFMRSRKKFFIPVKILSKVFRGKFLALLKQAFAHKKVRLPEATPPHDAASIFQGLVDSLYEKPWVVYCKKPFKTPLHVVRYLSRYTHKTAISNSRLVAMDQESVTFSYRDYKDNSKVKFMKLGAMAFMRRFMLHVLPSGFQRIRYYGFLANCNRKTKLHTCLRLTHTPIRRKVKLTARELILKVTGVDISICPSCGGTCCPVLTLHPDSG